MKRRIQETDRNRASLQCFVKLLKIALLLRKDLRQCCFSLFYRLRADHLAECVDTVALKEHMLGTAKTDTFCAKLTCLFCIVWGICICTNLHGAVFVCPSHDAAELTCDRCVYGRDDPVINASGRTVDGEPVSLMVLFACKYKLLIRFVHCDFGASGYAAGTHTTCNNGCMACHAAADSQDALSTLHTLDVLR